MMKKPLCWILCLAALMAGSGGETPAESVTLTIDRPTLLMFLRAATPYSFDVTKLGLTETLTLDRPREMRFQDGKIRLKIDCTGDPIPFSAELIPTLSVHFDRTKNAFIAEVEKMPVRIGALGTIHLDEYIEPVVIPVTFSQPLEIGVPGLSVHTIIRNVAVLEDRIEARADLIFHRQDPPASAAAQP